MTACCECTSQRVLPYPTLQAPTGAGTLQTRQLSQTAQKLDSFLVPSLVQPQTCGVLS